MHLISGQNVNGDGFEMTPSDIFATAPRVSQTLCDATNSNKYTILLAKINKMLNQINYHL